MTSHSNETKIFTQGISAIQKASLGGTLTWKGKKALVDPYTEVDFTLHLEMVSPKELKITPYVLIGGKERPLASFEGVFPSCIIEHYLVRFFTESIPSHLLKEHLLNEQEISPFLKTVSFPLVWKNKPSSDPLPMLVLTDRTGAFANLWMDRGIFGKSQASFPLTEEELAWEKDLLQTDFRRKASATSHYYCPMDKIGKSLAFLIDIGWDVRDAENRCIYRQKPPSIEVFIDVDRFILRGSIHYGTHQKELSDVVGAFNRRQQFVNLSEDSVGLIDLSSWSSILNEDEIVVTETSISIPKNRIGLLEDVVCLPEEFRPTDWKPCFVNTTFQGTLYPYQQKGVDWLSFLYRLQYHGLLADEMGLGKTVQVLAFLSTLAIERPILIVMPYSLLFNWRRECAQFLPNWPVQTYVGEKRSLEACLQAKIILTTYSLMRQDIEILKKVPFEAVILDEAQTIKNRDSQTSQAACQLNALLRLAITGTPIENRYEDLWSIFRFLNPSLLKDRSLPKESVQKKIAPFFLRRTKNSVQLDLPPLQQQTVWVDLSPEEQTFYDQLLASYKGNLNAKVQQDGLSKHRLEILEAILRLRQTVCHPHLVDGSYTGNSSKLERLLSDLEEATLSGQKTIVYSQFTTMLRIIEKNLKERGLRFLYLDGSTKDRERVISDFQNDPSSVIFLISLKAGGVGLNLTAADYIFLYDPWWNEAVERQAIDRAHRIGRKESVIVRRYLTVQTIEEKIDRLKKQKNNLANSFLEFSESASLEDLYEMI